MQTSDTNKEKKANKWGEKKIQAPGGFEPSTFCLLGRRSNQLSYGALSTMAALY